MCVCVSHRCGQPRGQSHLQVSLEAEQSGYQDEDLCDVLERLPVLQTPESHFAFLAITELHTYMLCFQDKANWGFASFSCEAVK